MTPIVGAFAAVLVVVGLATAGWTPAGRRVAGAAGAVVLLTQGYAYWGFLSESCQSPASGTAVALAGGFVVLASVLVPGPVRSRESRSG
ncbi:MAG: hypothetical protein ABEJ42_10690 [Halobacteriaceae archaeon]